jgi:RNA polymerase sigma-70 factor (ECF subfamily)
MGVFIQAVSAPRQPPAEPAAQPATRWTFDAVYEAHFAFVWRTVRRLGVLDSAVEDVAQETFLVVHRRLASFDGRSCIKSWLFAIVVRVVSDARRSLRRKPANLGSRARTGEDVDSVSDPSAVCPHESAEKAEAVHTLHALLDAMPDERRQVFILSELEQMSAVDIASAVKANVNTVYSRLRAARADFQRAVARLHASRPWRVR